jgi:hypothetical protein
MMTQHTHTQALFYSNYSLRNKAHVLKIPELFKFGNSFVNFVCNSAAR